MPGVDEWGILCRMMNPMLLIYTQGVQFSDWSFQQMFMLQLPGAAISSTNNSLVLFLGEFAVVAVFEQSRIAQGVVRRSRC